MERPKAPSEAIAEGEGSGKGAPCQVWGYGKYGGCAA